MTSPSPLLGQAAGPGSGLGAPDSSSSSSSPSSSSPSSSSPSSFSSSSWSPSSAPSPAPAPSSAPAPDPDPAPALAPPSPPSPMLQLPADVLLLVCDQLDAPAAVALSLSCKSVFALRRAMGPWRRDMAPDERRRFLLLLEADARMGRRVFYCHACNSLHPFGRDWGPRSAGEPGGRLGCGRRDRFALAGNPFGLSYHHARLVMNEHLFGPGRGLALARICVAHTERRPAATIRCSTDARVRGGELLLLRTYAFSVADDAVAEFRRGGGPRDFRLCEHTCFFPHSSSSPYRQHVPQLQPPASGDAAFPPCRDAPGSCRLCLMDYLITVAPAEPAEPAAWRVTIRAYHQLGPCRSPDDWKWARFSEANRPHLFFPSRPNRRGSAFAPGAVRRRWLGELGPDPDGLPAPGPASAGLPRDDAARLPCPEPS